MSFSERLNSKIEQKNSRLLVGLDPHVDLLPKSFLNSFDTLDMDRVLVEYFRNVIKEAAPYAAAFKPQIAFFESFGLAGLSALKTLMDELRQMGEIIILDGKRNDIGSTAKAYASAYFGTGADFEADALTVNAYLGSDGIFPFLDYPEKAVFALLKTSNPSSGEFQDLKCHDGRPLYEQVADRIQIWNQERLCNDGFGPVGVVVGATYPDHMKKLRNHLPNSLFLVPGYGAQGGAGDAVRAAFLTGGRGALINSSRGINFPKGFEAKEFEAVAIAAETARDEINSLALD